MFWIVLFVFLNHLNIPHTPNPLFPSNFLFSFPNTFPNLFQILHCFISHTPRQFRPSLSPFSFFFFAHSLPVCIQNAVQHHSCFFFQHINAHNHTPFFNSSKVPDSSLFFILLLTHLRITSWIVQTFQAFFILYSSHNRPSKC